MVLKLSFIYPESGQNSLHQSLFENILFKLAAFNSIIRVFIRERVWLDAFN